MAPAGADPADDAAVFNLITAQRAASGQSGLYVVDGLNAQANLHAHVMAGVGALFHHTNLAAVANAVPGWTAAGENVGVGGSAGEVHAQMMASPAHQANVLGAFTYTGIGTARDRYGRLWVTEVFVR